MNDVSDAKLSFYVTLVGAVLRMVRLTPNLLSFRYLSVSFGLVIFKEEREVQVKLALGCKLTRVFFVPEEIL